MALGSSDRMRDDGFKLHRGRFTLDIRQNFSPEEW